MRIIESIKQVAIVQLTHTHFETKGKGHIFHSSDNTSILNSPLFNDIFGASEYNQREEERREAEPENDGNEGDLINV